MSNSRLDLDKLQANPKFVTMSAKCFAWVAHMCRDAGCELAPSIPITSAACWACSEVMYSALSHHQLDRNNATLISNGYQGCHSPEDMVYWLNRIAKGPCQKS